MYPQERFAYHKRPFWPVLCLKRIGLSCCTFVTIIVTCLLQIILLSNYSVTYNFSTCTHYLVENHLSFPSSPHWVRHSYLPKRDKIDPLYLWVISLACAYLWWQWDIMCHLMYVLVINLRVQWPCELMHRGWHTFSSWFSGRNFGALFEVLCVGWIDESEIVWCISYNHTHGYLRWHWSI